MRLGFFVGGVWGFLFGWLFFFSFAIFWTVLLNASQMMPAYESFLTSLLLHQRS